MSTAIQQLPATGYLRIWHIVGNQKAEPPIPAILPISRSSFLNRVRSGEFPQPIKLGERTTCWRVHDIMALVEKLNGTGYEPTKGICEKKITQPEPKPEPIEAKLEPVKPKPLPNTWAAAMEVR